MLDTVPCATCYSRRSGPWSRCCFPSFDSWLPTSRAIAIFATALSLAACSTIPSRMAVPTSVQVTQCGAMHDPEWHHSEAPSEALELLAMPRFHPWERGIVWFSHSSGRFSACAFTDDKNGCGFTTHEFMRVGERWYYSPGSLLERICIIG